jgi:hypothetical protein
MITCRSDRVAHAKTQRDEADLVNPVRSLHDVDCITIPFLLERYLISPSSRLFLLYHP